MHASPTETDAVSACGPDSRVGFVAQERGDASAAAERFRSALRLRGAPHPQASAFLWSAAGTATPLGDLAQGALADLSDCELIVAMDSVSLAGITASYPGLRGRIVARAAGAESRAAPPERGGVSADVIDELAERLTTGSVVQAEQARDPIRAQLRALLASAPARAVGAAVGPAAATIFMLHRFSRFRHSGLGDFIGDVRDCLQFLRRHRYPIASLRSVVERLRANEAIERRTVVFTVDDGYRDVLEVAAPVFAEFDCPVTVFLTTGFVDRTHWMWWDQLRWVLWRSEGQHCALECGEFSHELRWSSPAGRRAAFHDASLDLKRWPTVERETAIRNLAHALGHELPVLPPKEHSALTWEEVRSLEHQGFEFGAHTVTHPILSRCDDRRSRQEIVDSVARLAEEVSSPCPVFCHPNGEADDFGDRERATLREVAQAAVSTTVGYCDARAFARDRMALPRFAFEADGERVAQIVSGVERLKTRLRHGW